MDVYIWLGISVLLAIVEAFSLTLITIWFVIGGIAASIAAYFGANLAVQIGIFLVVSVASLLLFRPLALKHRELGQAHEPDWIGKHAVVVEAIDNDALSGRVETSDHMTWAALSKDGTPIEVGTNVVVVDRSSIKLIVERA